MSAGTQVTAAIPKTTITSVSVAEAPADRTRMVEARGDGKEDAVGGPVRVADTEGTIRLIHLV